MLNYIYGSIPCSVELAHKYCYLGGRGMNRIEVFVPSYLLLLQILDVLLC